MVGGRDRLSDKALNAAEARGDREVFELVDDGGRRLGVTIIDEAQDPAETTHLRGGDIMTREIRQAGIIDLLDLRVVMQKFRYSLRVCILLPDADHKRPQATREQEGHLGRHHLSEVLSPSPDRIDQCLLRYHHAARQIAMASEILGCAVDDDVGSELQGRLVDRGGESVVDDDEHAAGFGHLYRFGDVDDFHLWVGRRLEEENAGAVRDDFGQTADLAAEQEGRVDVEVWQIAIEQFVGASIDVADADDVIAIAAVGEDRGGLSGHAGTEDQRGLPAFDDRELALDRSRSGIEAIACIEIAFRSSFDDIEKSFGGRKPEC